VAPSRIIHVRNKIDLVSDSKQRGAVRGTAIRTSALTGEGIEALAAAIGRSLVPDPPAAGAAIPFTPPHVESLEVARNAIERRHAAAACEALQSLLAM
jgi:tRNA modification GTPase